MKHSIAIFILAAFALQFGASAKSGNAGPPVVQDLTIEGELKRTVEAGGWLVRSNGTEYLILNSNGYEKEPWFQEGVRVRATGQIKRDVATIYMQGTPFQARTMQPVRDTGRTVWGSLKRIVEPGGWLIDSGGTDYLIVNANRYESSPWFREGASVRATGEVKRNTATIYMQGTPFEVRSMEAFGNAGGERSVTVVSDTAAPGEMIRIRAEGFPRSTSVAVGLGPTESEYNVVKRARTTARGTLKTSVRVPRYANDGRNWVAVVTTGSARGLNKTISNVFRIRDREKEQPSQDPIGRLLRNYLIQPGDTLFSIARRFGVSMDELMNQNPEIRDPGRIFAGRKLKIPSEGNP